VKTSTGWETSDPKTTDQWAAEDKQAGVWDPGDKPVLRYTFGAPNVTFGQAFVNFGNIVNNNQINTAAPAVWSEA
jgi:hypothetical protein